jgi:hypothetical protein
VLFRSICVLNLLLGWTFLGWVAALVWSLTGDTESNRIAVVQNTARHAGQSARLLSRPYDRRHEFVGVVDAFPAAETLRERIATLPSDIAPIRGMNLAPIRIEDTHRDGARRPINVGHKRDGARDASCVGAPFPKDVGRTVEELDSVLHDPSS